MSFRRYVGDQLFHAAHSRSIHTTALKTAARNTETYVGKNSAAQTLAQSNNAASQFFNKVNGQALIMPNGFDAYAFMIQCAKKTKLLDPDEISRLFNMNNPFFSPLRALEKFLILNKATPLTHSTMKSDTAELILKDGHLRDLRQSSGVASQPGICLSTDVQSFSLVDAILNKLDCSMLFFNVLDSDLSKLFITSSAYSLGDKVTVKSTEEALPIQVTALYNASTKQLEIIDADQFVDINVRSLLSSYLLMQRYMLECISGVMTAFKIPPVKPDGKIISLEEFNLLSTPNLIATLNNTQLTLANGHEGLRVNRQYTEMSQNIEAIADAAIKLLAHPALQKALQAKPDVKQGLEYIAQERMQQKVEMTLKR